MMSHYFRFYNEQRALINEHTTDNMGPWGSNGQMSCHYFPGAFQEMADQRSEGRTGCCRRSSAFALQPRTASGVSLLALPTVGAEAARSRAQTSLPVATTGPAKMAALWPAGSSHTHSTGVDVTLQFYLESALLLAGRLETRGVRANSALELVCSLLMFIVCLSIDVSSGGRVPMSPVCHVASPVLGSGTW